MRSPTIERQRLVIACAATVLVMTMFAAHQLGHDSGITGWIRVGETVSDPDQLPPGMYQEAGLGYDGKHYYRLARAPFSTAETVDGLEFDRPAFRHQRIGYPIAAWVLSGGGRQAAVPWAMVAVNAAAMIGSALALAQLAAQRGKSPWLGLAGAALPASVMAFHFNLAESLEACLLLWTLVLLDQRRWWWAVALLSAAVVTRETALVLAAALAASSVIHFVGARIGRRLATAGPPWWVGLVPAAIYGSWTLWISSLWDEPGESARRSAEHFSPSPLALLRVLADLPGRPGFDVVAIGLFVAAGVIGVLAIRATQSPLHEVLALLFTTIVAVTFSGWDRAVVYLRHPGLWILFALVVAISSNSQDPMPSRARAACLLVLVLGLVLTGEIVSATFPEAPTLR